jgi:hypothetical protein
VIFLNPKARLDQFADLVGSGVVLSGFLVRFCPFDKAREIVQVLLQDLLFCK